MCTFNAPIGPLQVLVRWRGKKYKKPCRIGSIALDYVIRVDNISPGPLDIFAPSFITIPCVSRLIKGSLKLTNPMSAKTLVKKARVY